MISTLKGIQTVLEKIRIAHKSHIRTAVDLAHVIHGPPLSTSPPFIMMHGFLGSKKNWTTVGRQLSEILNKTVIAVDMRNHGESPYHASHTYIDLAEDIVQLMNKLNISKADLIGHSMGGRTAMVVALTMPNRVDNLIVIDISPITTPSMVNIFFPRLLEAMKCVNFDGAQNVEEARHKAKEDIIASGVEENIRSLSFVVLNVGKTANKSIGWTCNVEALKNNFHLISSFPNNVMRNKQFMGRTLFIGGGKSDFLPPEEFQGIKKIFPNATLQFMDGVGHSPHTEDRSGFICVVVDFMTKKTTQ